MGGQTSYACLQQWAQDLSSLPLNSAVDTYQASVQQSTAAVFGWRRRLNREEDCLPLILRLTLDEGTFDTTITLTAECLTPLSDFPPFTYAEALLLLKDVLHALRLIKQNYGYFTPTTRTIKINQQGRVKLWLNENLGKCVPEEGYELEKIANENIELSIVNNLVRMVRQKIKDGSSMQEYPQLLNFGEAEEYVVEMIRIHPMKVDKIYKDRRLFQIRFSQGGNESSKSSHLHGNLKFISPIQRQASRTDINRSPIKSIRSYNNPHVQNLQRDVTHVQNRMQQYPYIPINPQSHYYSPVPQSLQRPYFYNIRQRQGNQFPVERNALQCQMMVQPRINTQEEVQNNYKFNIQPQNVEIKSKNKINFSQSQNHFLKVSNLKPNNHDNTSKPIESPFYPLQNTLQKYRELTNQQPTAQIKIKPSQHNERQRYYSNKRQKQQQEQYQKMQFGLSPMSTKACLKQNSNNEVQLIKCPDTKLPIQTNDDFMPNLSIFESRLIVQNYKDEWKINNARF